MSLLTNQPLARRAADVRRLRDYPVTADGVVTEQVGVRHVTCFVLTVLAITTPFFSAWVEIRHVPCPTDSVHA